MPAPDVIKNLVQRFEEHRDSYRSGRYNETQLRRENMVSLMERMLELHKRSPRTPQEQAMVKRALGRAQRMQDRACGGRDD